MPAHHQTGGHRAWQRTQRLGGTEVWLRPRHTWVRAALKGAEQIHQAEAQRGAEHAPGLRTRDRELKVLKKISQSVGRLESGEYGFCDETGEPIGLGRLIARPTATLSLEAQQRRELKQKMFGD